MKTVYLDNAATTRPLDEVVLAMETSMREGFFNPSSSYAPAIIARNAVEACRTLLKSELKAPDVVFTSGGTESDNLGVIGRMRKARKRGRILFSMSEHPAVSEACLSLLDLHEVLAIPLHPNGSLDMDALETLLTMDTALICVMQVSNEVGVVQPLEDVLKLRDRLCPEAALHVDGVQGFLRLPVHLRSGIDSYALSAHKIHGPKGIGALALGKNGRLNPLLYGGGQEMGQRSGTENTLGIAGLQAAVHFFPRENIMRQIKLRLYTQLRNLVPDLIVNGPNPDSALACGHILNLSFPPVRAETLMHALEGKGVYVSHGSACSAGKKTKSPTLTGMGINGIRLESSIRFSLSPFTTEAEVDFAADACARAYRQLYKFIRK
jgi:cysteine desulfurase